MRKFEVVSAFKGDNPTIPTRKTKESAGYDLEALGSYKIGPGAVVIINTGIKAAMNPGEFLSLQLRSSIAIKRKLMLVNSRGIIDGDYYNNPDNEGHIMVAVFNPTGESVEIKNRERVAQAIFEKYLVVDEEREVTEERKGGIGSTGKK